MAEKHKILVVDDEPVVIESAEKILRAEGFGVHASSDAESALDMLRAETPDIVLIDLKLPKLSGMDLLEIVAKESPQIAIIMMTGYTTEENAITSLQKGAFDFLPKPFAFEELLATVRRADRFVKLSMASRRTQLNESARDYYRLGMHSWAKLGADGTAQLGVTDIFQKTVGMIRQIELPAVNDEIRQGGLLAQIVAADQMKHAAWAALSGRVLESNHNAEQNPTSLNLDPFGSGWLVRIIPINLEDELNHLSKA